MLAAERQAPRRHACSGWTRVGRRLTRPAKGGYFRSLDSCNDAIRHLTYYGNKVGAACAEIPDWQCSAISGK